MSTRNIYSLFYIQGTACLQSSEEEEDEEEGMDVEGEVEHVDHADQATDAEPDIDLPQGSDGNVDNTVTQLDTEYFNRDVIHRGGDVKDPDQTGEGTESDGSTDPAPVTTETTVTDTPDEGVESGGKVDPASVTAEVTAVDKSGNATKSGNSTDTTPVTTANTVVDESDDNTSTTPTITEIAAPVTAEVTAVDKSGNATKSGNNTDAAPVTTTKTVVDKSGNVTKSGESVVGSDADPVPTATTDDLEEVEEEGEEEGGTELGGDGTTITDLDEFQLNSQPSSYIVSTVLYYSHKFS